MAPSGKPASPLEDLAQWRRQSAALEDSPLTRDLAALAQSGVSLTLGACRPDGRPIVGLGVGCRVRPDGTIRVLLSRAANAALLEAVEGGSAVAATFTAAPDHRAFQVKAQGAAVSEACSDDVPETDRQCALFRDGLVEIGFSPELAAGYVAYDPDQLVALEIRPERLFTQTPGPGAGAELVR